MAQGCVLWARPLKGRLRIGSSSARERPPIGVQAIAVIDAIDRNIMLKWCREKVKSGWTVAKLKAACEVS